MSPRTQTNYLTASIRSSPGPTSTSSCRASRGSALPLAAGKGSSPELCRGSPSRARGGPAEGSSPCTKCAPCYCDLLTCLFLVAASHPAGISHEGINKSGFKDSLLIQLLPY